MKETTLCYLENGDRYLMMLRNKKENDPNKDKWIGVGGKLNPGETPVQCAHREIFEETGISTENLKYAGRVYFVSDVWENELMHLFVAHSDDDKVSCCNEGTLKWIKKEDILSLNLWEGDKVFLNRLLNENKDFFEITLTYSGETLISVKE